MESSPTDSKTWHYDRHGVPLLTAKQVEEIAQDFLQTYCPTHLSNPGTLPVSTILQKVQARDGLRVSFPDLGQTDGKRIRGRITFSQQRIDLDSGLLSDDRSKWFAFTAMHELGHWVLHRYRPIRWAKAGVLTDGRPRRLRNRLEIGAPDWIEWQANKFAAFALMPRRPFLRALEQVQSEQGLSRRGEVWVNNSNVADYKKTYAGLARKFGVSMTAVRYQLNDLQLHRGNEERYEANTWKRVTAAHETMVTLGVDC